MSACVAVSSKQHCHSCGTISKCSSFATNLGVMLLDVPFFSNRFDYTATIDHIDLGGTIMNPIQHARISARKRGGEPEDYVDIHALIDSTKMLCTDNRHRILHTFWAVQEIIIPVFGHTITNSAGQTVDVKDLCEKDHLLPDFQHRFIPTLGDFVAAMQDVPTQGLAQRLERFHADVIKDEALSARMLSPLAATGQLKSLLITHNSWFINTILPMMRVSQPQWIDFDITPDAIFNPMRFELWMDNGSDVPPSARQLQRLKQVHF